MSDLGLSGAFYGASDSGELSLSGSGGYGVPDDDPLSGSSGYGAPGDDASPGVLEETLETSQVGTPLPLHEKYTIEKEWGGAAMADYLHALTRQHPGLTLEQMRELPQMKALQQIFSATKDKTSPENAVNAALKDPRMKDILAWADKSFQGLTAYDTKAKDITKVKLLLAVRRGVKYISDETKRAKYAIGFNAGAVQRGASHFDTETLRRMYMKKPDQLSAVPEGPHDNNAPAPAPAAVPDDPSKRGNYVIGRDVIWVMDNNGNFYSHVSKMGRIHHSSFLAGEAICAGGDWKIENGEITEISGQSGHYKPTLDRFLGALNQLEERGALKGDKPVVKVWEKDTKAEKKVSLVHLRFNTDKYYPYKPA
jgi:hypothetical protein